ncbi:MAG TPA: hypothetical protein VF221_15370 [Chloroflexota bacterium]
MAHLGRPVIGWLGEQSVDQALLVSSGGRLIPWLPLIDAHGIDRAYSWNGVGEPWFVQTKTSGSMEGYGNHQWTIRVGSMPTHPRFRVVLCASYPEPWRLDDISWCLDAAAVRRLAIRDYDTSSRTELYHLVASSTHRDHLAGYRYFREELWKLFAPADGLKAGSRLRLPSLRIDQGGLYEFAVITELLRANHKDLLVFRPAMDIDGRDLLLHLVGSPLALYLQVKGTAASYFGGTIEFHVRRSTFAPADDFWLVLVFWDQRINNFFPDCWLMSSRELVNRTAYQQNSVRISVDAHLDRSKDRWADRRYPVNDLAKVLRAALTDLRLAA